MKGRKMTREKDKVAPEQPRGQVPQTGAERQQGYRQRKKLRFLEVTEETRGRLRAICEQKGWSIEQTVVQALTLLEAELQVEARSAALAEIHKREQEAQLGSSPPVKQPKQARKPIVPAEPVEVAGQGSLL
jgi:hypothetical protein